MTNYSKATQKKLAYADEMLRKAGVTPEEIEQMLTELKIGTLFGVASYRKNESLWTPTHQEFSTNMDITLENGTELKLGFGYWSGDHTAVCLQEGKKIVRYLNKKGLLCLVGKWRY